MQPSPKAETEGPLRPKVRWGMLIDTSKCVQGCTACVDACDEVMVKIEAALLAEFQEFGVGGVLVGELFPARLARHGFPFVGHGFLHCHAAAQGELPAREIEA